jgi:hypothetical protein
MVLVLACQAFEARFEAPRRAHPAARRALLTLGRHIVAVEAGICSVRNQPPACRFQLELDWQPLVRPLYSGL